jgi:rubrerythrin
MVAERATAYQVCRNCGWIEDGQRPQKCPNCQRAADSFDEVI